MPLSYSCHSRIRQCFLAVLSLVARLTRPTAAVVLLHKAGTSAKIVVGLSPSSRRRGGGDGRGWFGWGRG